MRWRRRSQSFRPTPGIRDTLLYGKDTARRASNGSQEPSRKSSSENTRSGSDGSTKSWPSRPLTLPKDPSLPLASCQVKRTTWPWRGGALNTSPGTVERQGRAWGATIQGGQFLWRLREVNYSPPNLLQVNPPRTLSILSTSLLTSIMRKLGTGLKTNLPVAANLSLVMKNRQILTVLRPAPPQLPISGLRSICARDGILRHLFPPSSFTMTINFSDDDMSPQ